MHLQEKKLKDFNGHELAQTPGGGKEQGEKGWSAAVHGVTKSWIWLSNWTTKALILKIKRLKKN